MPATKTDTEWDVELSHVRVRTKRYPHSGIIKARRIQQKDRAGEWSDFLHARRHADGKLQATTKPELREALRPLNERAQREINRRHVSRAVRKRERLMQARRRNEARGRFEKWCKHEFDHLKRTYDRSRQKFATTGGPDPKRRKRSFVEWLSVWLPEHRPAQWQAFKSKWQRIRRDCGVPEDTHYL